MIYSDRSHDSSKKAPHDRDKEKPNEKETTSPSSLSPTSSRLPALDDSAVGLEDRKKLQEQFLQQRRHTSVFGKKSNSNTTSPNSLSPSLSKKGKQPTIASLSPILKNTNAPEGNTSSTAVNTNASQNNSSNNPNQIDGDNATDDSQKNNDKVRLYSTR